MSKQYHKTLSTFKIAIIENIESALINYKEDDWLKISV